MTGISISYLHKLTANRVIEFYRPFGKRIFFTQEQIDEIFARSRIRRKEDNSVCGTQFKNQN